MLQIREFPDDLHRRLRVAAAQRDVPLRELVIQAAEEKLAILESEERGDG